MNMYFLDDEHNPVRMDDIREWDDDRYIKNRRVDRTEVGEATVSTVFLGIDYGYIPNAVPVLFETMIFGGENSDWCQRYCTWSEAKTGHDKVVAALRDGTSLDFS